MEVTLLHIFRNTPLGRESFLQSIYFCQQLGAIPIICIPEATKFLMYFDHDVVQIDLDGSYLTAPETAVAHATELLETNGMPVKFITPQNYTASNLPDLPTNFNFMGCPRSMSDLSSKIGLGYIGPRVRRIVKSARFPILMNSSVFKKWKSIAVFFGGSDTSISALKLGFRIQQESGMPMRVYTQIEKTPRDEIEKMIQTANIEQAMQRHVTEWHFFVQGRLEENLYQVPHDALVIVGAYGHGLIKELLFGSKLETIQTTLSNSMLIAGPNYTLK